MNQFRNGFGPMDVTISIDYFAEIKIQDFSSFRMKIKYVRK